MNIRDTVFDVYITAIPERITHVAITYLDISIALIGSFFIWCLFESLGQKQTALKIKEEKKKLIDSLEERERKLMCDSAEWHKHDGYQKQRDERLDEKEQELERNAMKINKSEQLWNNEKVTEIRNGIEEQQRRLKEQEAILHRRKTQLDGHQAWVENKEKQYVFEMTRLNLQKEKDRISKNNATQAMLRHKKKNTPTRKATNGGLRDVNL